MSNNACGPVFRLFLYGAVIISFSIDVFALDAAYPDEVMEQRYSTTEDELASLDAKIKELEGEIEKTTADLQQKSKEVKAQKQKVQEAKNTLRQTESEVTSLEGRAKTIDSRLRNINRDIASIERDLADFQRKEASLNAELAKYQREWEALQEQSRRAVGTGSISQGGNSERDRIWSNMADVNRRRQQLSDSWWKSGRAERYQGLKGQSTETDKELQSANKELTDRKKLVDEQKKLHRKAEETLREYERDERQLESKLKAKEAELRVLEAKRGNLVPDPQDIEEMQQEDPEQGDEEDSATGDLNEPSFQDEMFISPSFSGLTGIFFSQDIETLNNSIEEYRQSDENATERVEQAEKQTSAAADTLSENNSAGDSTVPNESRNLSDPPDFDSLSKADQSRINEIADQAFHDKHPELGGKPLSSDAPDALRQEWLEERTKAENDAWNNKLTDDLFRERYPEAPHKLNQNDPAQDAYVKEWTSIRNEVEQQQSSNQGYSTDTVNGPSNGAGLPSLNDPDPRDISSFLDSTLPSEINAVPGHSSSESLEAKRYAIDQELNNLLDLQTGDHSPQKAALADSLQFLNDATDFNVIARSSDGSQLSIQAIDQNGKKDTAIITKESDGSLAVLGVNENHLTSTVSGDLLTIGGKQSSEREKKVGSVSGPWSDTGSKSKASLDGSVGSGGSIYSDQLFYRSIQSDGSGTEWRSEGQYGGVHGKGGYSAGSQGIKVGVGVEAVAGKESAQFTYYEPIHRNSEGAYQQDRWQLGVETGIGAGAEAGFGYDNGKIGGKAKVGLGGWVGGKFDYDSNITLPSGLFSDNMQSPSNEQQMKAPVKTYPAPIQFNWSSLY